MFSIAETILGFNSLLKAHEIFYSWSSEEKIICLTMALFSTRFKVIFYGFQLDLNLLSALQYVPQKKNIWMISSRKNLFRYCIVSTKVAYCIYYLNVLEHNPYVMLCDICIHITIEISHHRIISFAIENQSLELFLVYVNKNNRMKNHLLQITKK